MKDGKEVVAILKSTNKNRIIENAQVFDFELEEEDIKALDSLDGNYRFGADQIISISATPTYNNCKIQLLRNIP